MNYQSSFFIAVQKSFSFLIEKFGYTIYDRRFEPEDAWSDGNIEIVSSFTKVRIQKDRAAFVIFIKPIAEPKVSEMSLPWILEALSIMKRNDFPGEVQPEEFERILRFNSQILEWHCAQIIQGDFSRWNMILEYYVDSSKRNYFIETGKKMPDRIHKDLEDYIRARKLEENNITAHN